MICESNVITEGIKICSFDKHNLGNILPQLMSLEKNWTGIGETPWHEDNFRLELPGKWELSVHAKDNEKLVGYAICSYKDDIGKLNKILTDKSYRRKGIASMLWLEFVNRCREKALKRIEFKVLTENGEAVNFYRKKGCLISRTKKGTDSKDRYIVKYVFKANEIIKHSKPSIDENDINEIVDALRKGELATGNIVEEFVRILGKRVSKKYGIATSSGSCGLHLALKALGIQEGDEVIFPSYVCNSVLNSVKHCRAVPVIADINDMNDEISNDYNISYQDTAKKISNKTKAIIVPHMFGNPVKDIEKFMKLKIPIIEDCAMAIGAEINGKKIGGFGDIAVFSFYATKMITTGVGGIVLTDDDKVYKKLEDLSQYDNRDAAGESYNYRMSDIQAALGLSQLSKLDGFVKKRKEIAESYNRIFSEHKIEEKSPLRFPINTSKDNIFFRYVIKIKKANDGKIKASDGAGEDKLKGFIQHLKSRGVDAGRPVFKPLHRYLDLDDRDFPNTAAAHNSALSIPIYPDLSFNQIEEIASLILNSDFEMHENKNNTKNRNKKRNKKQDINKKNKLR